MEENKKPLAYKHQTRKFLYHPVHHHWKSQHYFWGSHYENHGSLGELVDLEVQAEPKLRRAGVDLQRAVLQVVLFCKTSSFQPVLFISLPNMPSQSLIWGENKHSVFNSVNRFENVHGNWIFFSPNRELMSADTEGAVCFWEASGWKERSNFGVQDILGSKTLGLLGVIGPWRWGAERKVGDKDMQ